MRRLRRIRAGRGSAPEAVVTLPGKRSGPLYIRRKTPGPRLWRNIASALYPAPIPYSSILDNWVLVLEACRIPHRVMPERRTSRLYVPAFLETKAIAEIRTEIQEKPVQPSSVAPADEGSIKGVVVFLLLLLLWHAFKMGWPGITLPGLPPGWEWPSAFGLDVTRVLYFHEWWRTASALTIHADNLHFFANAAFSLVFLIPLCRRAGMGLGLFMTVCAGIAGNAVNVYMHPPGFVSVGFSTALFGCVGAASALAATDIFRNMVQGRKSSFELRRLFYPLAAGLALLGLLGGAGELHVDYLAHVWGFVSGIAVGLIFAPVDAIIRHLSEKAFTRAQYALYALSLLMLALPWFMGA